jgi:hypothetical protein
MGGVEGNCDPGLICCLNQAPVIGATGGCVPEAQCSIPSGCTDSGNACDPSCAWDAACDPCCTGYCNPNGQCDDPPPVSCTGEGCDCTTGTEAPCDDGLVCCGTTDTPGGPGVCTANC